MSYNLESWNKLISESLCPEELQQLRGIYQRSSGKDYGRKGAVEIQDYRRCTRKDKNQR
jgi:hypothetical protein